MWQEAKCVYVYSNKPLSNIPVDISQLEVWQEARHVY